MTHSNGNRRVAIKTIAIASIGGLTLASQQALAAKNEALRKSLNYVDKSPKPNELCSNCSLFVAGKTPTARGGCRVIPGDDEIAPGGHCSAWAKKA